MAGLARATCNATAPAPRLPKTTPGCARAGHPLAPLLQGGAEGRRPAASATGGESHGQPAHKYYGLSGISAGMIGLNG